MICNITDNNQNCCTGGNQGCGGNQGGGQGETVRVSAVRVSPSSVTLRPGEWYYGLQAEISPANATNKTVEWSSNNTSVATVNESSGFICGQCTGTTRIYADATDGSDAFGYCTVTVRDDIKITSIRLNESKIYLKKGERFALTATVRPENAVNQALSWRTNAPNVATVSDGMVYAIENGTAVITVVAQDSGVVTASCMVIVSDTVKVSSVEVEPCEKTMTVGESAYLVAVIEPESATDKYIYWASNNPEVVSVNWETGQILARKPGMATIYAAAQDGSKKKGSCEVKVTGAIPVSSIEINQKSIFMRVGEAIRLTATVYPKDATYKDIVWSSNNDGVVKVKNADTGFITTRSRGEAIITATTVDGQFQDSCRITVTYCNGENYRDVTRHRLTLEKDGYYECPTCKYRIKSPALQDREILSEDDFYKVQACYLAIPYYSTIEGSAAPQDRMMTNAIYAIIDNIRSKKEYADKYEYTNANGTYAREHSTASQTNSLLSINVANVKNVLQEAYYNDFIKSLAYFITGLCLPTSVSYLFTGMTLKNECDGLVAFLCDLANKAGEPALGLLVNLIALGASIEDNIKIGDKVVKICIPVGSAVYVSNIVFNPDGTLKGEYHDIE